MPFKKSGAIAVIIITFIVVSLPRLATYGIIPIDYLNIFEFINRAYAFLSIFIALGINIKALHRKKDGSKTILVGLVAFLIGVSLTTIYGYFNGWLLGLAALNIFITIAIAHQINDQRKRFHKSELKTTRLELELLKKHIQPHFLLNSLNSIMAWVEEEPEVATKLITELSQELRLLMSFAGEKKIALSQEIKLCRVHLEVMSLRQEKDFKLLVTGETEGVMIPPLILHTIVENGISHGFRKSESGEFYLNCKKDDGGKTIIVLGNNGESSSGRKSDGGTGNLYIRSRLEEVYGRGWSYRSESTVNGWKSEIVFRSKS
jgi:LytS/YehU family sensor histidine kinase